MFMSKIKWTSIKNSGHNIEGIILCCYATNCSRISLGLFQRLDLNSHDFLAHRRYSTLTRSATLAFRLRRSAYARETTSVSCGVGPREARVREREREKEREHIRSKSASMHTHTHTHTHKRFLRTYRRGGVSTLALCIVWWRGALDPSLLRAVCGV